MPELFPNDKELLSLVLEKEEERRKWKSSSKPWNQ